MLNSLLYVLTTLSVAGGGGSSSGGGGGSFSGGGGSSFFSGSNRRRHDYTDWSKVDVGTMLIMVGTLIALFALGFAPVYIATKHYARRCYETGGHSHLKNGQRIGILLGVILAIVGAAITGAIYISVGETSGNVLRFYDEMPNMLGMTALLVAIGALLGGYAGLRSYNAKIAQRQRSANLAKLAAKDSIWNEANIMRGVRNVYMAYQRDWSRLDIASTRTYLTPRYQRHAELMLRAFQDAGRRNNVIVKQIESINIGSVVDSDNDSQDQFEAVIMAHVTDQLFDVASDQLMTSGDITTTENWRFRRQGNVWLLDRVNPLTSDASVRESSILLFAEQHDAYYSLDWGRMLLPAHGQIFDSDSYKVADVNNHVIGQMHTTGRATSDDAIYQIYTYSRLPYHETSQRQVYLVGQIDVSKKRYGNIVIRRRRLASLPIRGLNRITLESSEFNDKYEVWAENHEQVTAFELLHPAMMQTFIDAPFDINLEVIDSAIYLYAPLEETDAGHYASMLSILQAAYRELKL